MRRSSICVSLAWLCVGLAPLGAGAQDVRIVTLAGDGVAGLRDGPAEQARFMLPSGVAWGGDGTLFVADSAAQRIRAIARGAVTTVAGGGSPTPDGMHVAGGYRDGSVLEARFNRPFGIAVGSDGALYVADEFNHCIRRIDRGTVTTFAGSPERSKALDGPAAVAGFGSPKALAFDLDGNLYVADFNYGVRRIARDGTVTTLPLPGAKTVTGVSAYGRGPSLAVYAANLEGLALYRVAGPPEFFSGRSEGDRPFGFPYGVAAVDETHVVFSDARQHTVRIFRGSDPPFFGTSFVRELTAAREDGDLAAGFADGDAATARFDAPLGIAIRDGTAAVADAGNRRIRSFRLPTLRRPVDSRFGDFLAGGRAYRIIVIGNSYVFWNALWDDSIPGLLENRLALDRSAIGLPAPPRVSVVRIDTGSLSQTQDYVDNYVVAGAADLVIFELDLAHLHFELERDKTLDEKTVFVRLQETLTKLNATLRARKAALFVAVQPTGEAVAPLEDLAARDILYTPKYTDAQLLAFDRQMVATVAASGIPYVAPLDAFLEYERGARPAPLYQTADPHFTRAGNAFFAGQLIAELERRRPWLR